MKPLVRLNKDAAALLAHRQANEPDRSAKPAIKGKSSARLEREAAYRAKLKGPAT